jgi:hypothetical protein
VMAVTPQAPRLALCDAATLVSGIRTVAAPPPSALNAATSQRNLDTHDLIGGRVAALLPRSSRTALEALGERGRCPV